MSADPAATPGEDRPVPPRRTTEAVACLACGCLCDDLVVTVEARAVVEARNACAAGWEWFRLAGDTPLTPEATIDGQAVATPAAIDRAAAILSGSRAPVVFGLTWALTETVRAALELAEVLGARVVLGRSGRDLGRVAAFQNVGRVSATLGEVKNRADVVVFWGTDPARTHPRHAARYSVEPAGRFVPEGRAGRTVVVVDTEPTETAAVADVFLAIPPEVDVAALTALRLLNRGVTPAGSAASLDLDRLASLLAVLKRAHYGAFFFQSRARRDDRSGADWAVASRLVRDLNETARFVLLGMGGPGNLPGAEAAMVWQGGFLQGVDYRSGAPAPLDDHAALDDILRARESDAFLTVGHEADLGLSAAALEHLRAIPTVVIGPDATSAGRSEPGVAIATARAGFDEGGTAVRVDGVALPVRAVAEAARPTAREVVREILRRCRSTAGAP